LTRRIHTKIPKNTQRAAPTAPPDISALLFNTTEDVLVSSTAWTGPVLLVGSAEFVGDCRDTPDRVAVLVFSSIERVVLSDQSFSELQGLLAEMVFVSEVDGYCDSLLEREIMLEVGTTYRVDDAVVRSLAEVKVSRLGCVVESGMIVVIILLNDPILASRYKLVVCRPSRDVASDCVLSTPALVGVELASREVEDGLSYSTSGPACCDVTVLDILTPVLVSRYKLVVSRLSHNAMLDCVLPTPVLVGVELASREVGGRLSYSASGPGCCDVTVLDIITPVLVSRYKLVVSRLSHNAMLVLSTPVLLGGALVSREVEDGLSYSASGPGYWGDTGLIGV
jgi:hypothetical protein